MNDYSLREYCPADIPELTRLWCRTFDDSEALVAGFFRLLPDMGTGLVAMLDGKLVGAAYIICGMELVCPGTEPMRCGYIYAVAVDDACRGLGIGRALTVAAAEKGRELGAKLICTLPAEHSLYKWYEDVIGVKTALYRKRAAIPCSPGALPLEIEADEYLARREVLLCGKPHLRLSRAAIEFQGALCREYGGGLYAIADGIACAYLDGDCCLVRELLCSDGSAVKGLAAALGHALKARQCDLYEAASEGDEYIAADEGLIPAHCVWNLSFD